MIYYNHIGENKYCQLIIVRQYTCTKYRKFQGQHETTKLIIQRIFEGDLVIILLTFTCSRNGITDKLQTGG